MNKNNLPNKKTVMLTITETCNIRPQCCYCYEKIQSDKQMSFETAITILDKELNSADDSSYVEIDFFGGEPFVAFPLIKRIYTYLKEHDWKKQWYCFATTNGTLVHGEIQSWLRENIDGISCGLSLDGTPEMHNLNRGNSFYKIDFGFFLELYPNQPVKMTISEQTLPNLTDGIIYIHKLGFKLTANLAMGDSVDWSDSKNCDILEEQLKKLVDFYLENPTYEPCSMLNMGIQYLYQESCDVVPKFCGCGTHMRAYTIVGIAYPCQMFMPLSTGKTIEDVTLNELHKPIPICAVDKKCQTCSIRNVCPTCYGANYAVSENLFYKQDEYCMLIKTQFKATAYLKFQKFKQQQLELSEDEVFRLLKGIEIVQHL